MNHKVTYEGINSILVYFYNSNREIVMGQDDYNELTNQDKIEHLEEKLADADDELEVCSDRLEDILEVIEEIESGVQNKLDTDELLERLFKL